MDAREAPGVRFTAPASDMSRRIDRLSGLYSVAWTLAVGGLFAGWLGDQEAQAVDHARTEARVHLSKDRVVRLWATSHGGIYVPPSQRTPPNPHLSHVPERDVVTPSGKQLTLMNPAYMLRQMMEDYADTYGVRGHITSLKPLRPENAADAWEDAALQRLEAGEAEVSEMVGQGARRALRVMQPLPVEEGCLKCHGDQGYRVGDVRGGVSVMVPFAPFEAEMLREARNGALSYAAVWLMGLLSMGFAHRLVRKRSGEKDEADARMRQSEERLRAITETSPDQILLLDLDGRVLFINRVIRRSREEVMGRPAVDMALPADRDAIIRTLKDVERTGQPGRVSFGTVIPDGRTLQMEALIGPAFENGKVVALTASVRDMTETVAAQRRLLESEERLRSVVDSAAKVVLLLDRDLRIQEFNPAAVDLHGVPRAAVLGLDYVETFVPAEEREAMRTELRRALVEEEPRTFEFPVASRLGEKRLVGWHVSAVRGLGRDPSGVIALGTDITTRRKQEEDLERARKLESLGVLAGGIAHDFNNILTGILSNLSLARMDLAAHRTDVGETLLEAERAALRAGALTRQLLTFSRGGAPVRKTASLPEVLRDSAAFALRGSAVRLVTECAPGLHAVELDTAQFSHVVHNLALNAKQAMPDGGEFHIHAHNTVLEADRVAGLAAGKYVEIEFRDSGVGIPPQYLGRVFDPYFTTKQAGSGLGLATAYSVIRQHQGHIRVRSEPGRGTTFTIQLPASAQTATPAPLEKTGKARGQGRILLMDDDAIVRQATERALTHLGYDVVSVDDGGAALAAWQDARAQGAPFLLAIMDLTVPGGMGGIEAARRVHALDPEARIIVASGYSDDPAMAEPTRFGFVDCVAKPFGAEELGTALHRVLKT